jgi:hypothetical protein
MFIIRYIKFFSAAILLLTFSLLSISSVEIKNTVSCNKNNDSTIKSIKSQELEGLVGPIIKICIPNAANRTSHLFKKSFNQNFQPVFSLKEYKQLKAFSCLSSSYFRTTPIYIYFRSILI